MAKKEREGRVVSENRKARYNYSIEDTVEAGMMLLGSEVKALREGRATIAEAYAGPKDGGFWLINAYIPEYRQANRENHEPRRPRKLLLHAREIAKLSQEVERGGMTVVPLSIYFNGRGRAKIELGLAKGKKLHDKRESEKERDWQRDKARLMRSRSYD
ncbi:SsrA-binding protein SmpB [Zavarzinia sp. CC-PAN008]|uniref:SsrA-binding protein SmpB n=1 Tax=Zavarzinia sp. CC-PAN008 TaxID=3243332 RepID=UPI003F7467F3